MKQALLMLFCSMFVLDQLTVCKAKENPARPARLKVDSTTNPFKVPWPGAGIHGLMAPAGLVHRLPPDGTWARFVQDDADVAITISSVGKMMVAQQPCRWIEVVIDVRGRSPVWKLLIPEDCLKKGPSILEHVLSMWHCEDQEQALDIIGSNREDEYGPLTFILTGPDQGVRPLEPQMIETKLGRFECNGWSGRRLLKFGEREADATFRQWIHEKAPFGVLRCEIEYILKSDDRVTQGKNSITLAEVGTGAVSRISTSKWSVEEFTARPFTPAAGWRWAVFPKKCNWGCMATQGLAMAIDRNGQEFRFTLAYPWTPGGSTFRPVAFDAKQHRYEFETKYGGGSGTVGLTVFVLAQNILPADQIERIGIEKQIAEIHKEPPSLMSKSLPSFSNIMFNYVPERADEKALLLCFFDMTQRPSRHCMTQLVKRKEELEANGITVVAIQASKIVENELIEWINKHTVPFPIGIVQSDPLKTRFTWGVKSLPWLILTDREYKVIAEGFALQELGTKIGKNGPSEEIPVDSSKVIGTVKGPGGQVLSGVRVTEFQTDKDYLTNGEGTFVSAFGPSDKRRIFFAVDKQRQLVGVGRLPLGKRHVEIKLIPAKIVSGTVVDPDGKPVTDAQVAPLPMTNFHVLTDNKGNFDVAWSPSWEPREGLHLMVRHANLNLAALPSITEDTKTIQVRLVPALTLTGTVEDPNGVPIAGAEVGLSLRRGWTCGTPIKKAVTDQTGRYEFVALPQGQEYINYADAEGYRRNQITTGVINRTITREEVGPIVLKRPILSVSGIVVHASGKPVANIPVHLRGRGQPDLDSKTDAQGRFMFEKVCSGRVEISAKNEALFGKIETEGGAKNVKLEVRPRFE